METSSTDCRRSSAARRRHSSRLITRRSRSIKEHRPSIVVTNIPTTSKFLTCTPLPAPLIDTQGSMFLVIFRHHAHGHDSHIPVIPTLEHENSSISRVASLAASKIGRQIELTCLSVGGSLGSGWEKSCLSLPLWVKRHHHPLSVQATPL